MGFFLFDFFRCDPFDLNFRILAANGFWPIATKNKYLQIGVSVYSFLCWFSIISMLFIQVVDIYLLRNDPVNLTKNLCATSVTVGSIAKYLTFFKSIDTVEELHNYLHQFKKRKTHPEDIELFKKADNDILRVTKALYTLAVPCIGIWMIFPGLEGREEHKVPFPYRLPIDDWSTPVYEIIYVYQSLSMIGFMVNILSTDLIFYGMVIRVSTEYEILIREIKALDESVHLSSNNNEDDDINEIDDGQMVVRYDPEKTERLTNGLRDIVDFHQDILRQIDQLKLIHSDVLLLHFITAVTMVGVIVIDILMISKGFRLQMMQRIMYTVNGAFDTFLMCHFTSTLEEKSIKLFRTIYSLQWFRISPNIRKNLLIMLMQSSKPPTFKLLHSYQMNLSMFLQFLKITYNITALLYQTVRK